jgi:hypothetical protein
MPAKRSVAGNAYSAAIKHKTGKGEAMDVKMSGKCRDRGIARPVVPPCEQ